MRQILLLASSVLYVLCPRVSQCASIFSLDSLIEVAFPGDTITFTGTLTNTTDSDLYLNADSFSISSTDLFLDDTAFFLFVPLVLAPGEFYSGTIFDVTISPHALPGDYYGSFTVYGGDDFFSFDELATEDFQVTVLRVIPEPSSKILTLTGVVVLLWVTARRARV